MLASRIPRTIAILALLLTCLSACRDMDEKSGSLFREVGSAESGLKFRNDISSDSSFNILSYMYFYNGAGVAAGDINNDGLVDLFLTGNKTSCRLYLNEGQMAFRDVTELAGLVTDLWATGAVMEDLNADGLLDIYVCVAGYPDASRRRNKLFINQGDGTFVDMAEEYGLADTSHTTHAAFLDYDRDGDLDVYLLNHMHQFTGPNDPLPKRLHGESPNTDKLYENKWNEQKGHPEYRDVSAKAGIGIEGFGLGVAVADIDLDGWADIYVSNDFVSNDILYLNNRDGTFSDHSGDLIAAQSHNGMGNDVADINNDGLPEIMVCDMLPRDNRRRKLMAMNVSYDLFEITQRMGYYPQYPRNTLQMHNGFDANGSLLPFSEIGQLAGIHDTDWSWSSLLADLDNDGDKDLFVTNGHLKDLTDLDFIVYRQQRTRFTTQRQSDSLYLALLAKMPGVEVPNRIFRNSGGLVFEDVTAEWYTLEKSFSNGAVYEDLDNDGDLDLVVNRVNQEVQLLENMASDQGANSITIRLNGPKENISGRGAKLYLFSSEGRQYYEQTKERGYMSSLSGRVHFGVAEGAELDSLVAIWPDQRKEVVTTLSPGDIITIDHDDAIANSSFDFYSHSDPIITSDSSLSLRHQELSFPDHKYMSLIPRSYSSLGPAISVGDIDGDGLEDIVMGAGLGYKTQMAIQQRDGSFEVRTIDSSQIYEDAGLLLFDVDGDNDLDLFAGSGSSENGADNSDRLYLNNGEGDFDHSQTLRRSISSCVNAADFDNDGDLDVFVGTRIIDENYGARPTSTLYINNNGQLVRAPISVLDSIGMVTSALWTDFDNDRDPDLIVVGEWMEITLIENENGRLLTPRALYENGLTGWWNSIVGGDFDNDGDTDYVIGNYGLNSDYRASAVYPIRLHTGYLDQNRSWDVLITRPIDNGSEELAMFPTHSRDQLLDRFNLLKKFYTSYESYASATEEDLFATEVMNTSNILLCEELGSMYLENEGDDGFQGTPLPLLAQQAPVHGMLVTDLNDDAYLDIVLGSNYFDNDVYRGRTDASIGVCLIGAGNGKFTPMGAAEIGYFAPGDMRSVAQLHGADGSLRIAATRRNADVLFYKTLDYGYERYSPQPQEVWKIFDVGDSVQRKEEFYYGSGYLSQTTRTIILPTRQIQ